MQVHWNGSDRLLHAHRDLPFRRTDCGDAASPNRSLEVELAETHAEDSRQVAERGPGRMPVQVDKKADPGVDIRLVLLEQMGGQRSRILPLEVVQVPCLVGHRLLLIHDRAHDELPEDGQRCSRMLHFARSQMV